MKTTLFLISFLLGSLVSFSQELQMARMIASPINDSLYSIELFDVCNQQSKDGFIKQIKVVKKDEDCQFEFILNDTITGKIEINYELTGDPIFPPKNKGMGSAILNLNNENKIKFNIKLDKLFLKGFKIYLNNQLVAIIAT